jgi:pantothenate kinase
MSHNFLSDQQLNEIEERYKSLQKLVMIDIESLIQEVRAYKRIINVSPNKPSNISWDELPMTLRPKNLEGILGRSPRKTYEFLSKPPFHVARDGSQIFISKAVFRNWLEGS